MASGIEIVGLKKVIKKLERLDKGIDEDFNGSALFSAALPILKSIKAKAPVKTGKTQSNVKRKRIKSGGRTSEVTVYLADKGFAGLFSEFGTAPHIVIKSGRAAKINGRYVIGPVKHPGQAESPWFRPGFDESTGEAIKRYAHVFRRKVKSLL